MVLAILFLFSCTGCANAPGETNTSDVTDIPESIRIDGAYLLVCPEAAGVTALQSAQCLQTTLEHKLNLPSLNITEEIPGDNAVVFNIDNTLSSGAFQTEIRGSSLYITAQSTHVLQLVTRSLCQMLLDNNTAVVTQQMCQQLTGQYDMQDLPFRIVTQNILSKDVDGGNTVEDRKPRFGALVREYFPDIIGIQEYSDAWKAYINAEFKDIYTEINPTGQCLLLRRDRYTVQESGFFYLSPTPDIRSQFEGDSGPRTCIWAIATDTLSGNTFLILNCHPDWNNDTQRTLQVEVIFAQMGEKIQQYPTLFCGDFNTLNTGPVYARITQTFKDTAVNAEHNLSDVDHTLHSFGKSNDLIDYIFYTGPLKPKNYRIISDMYKGHVSDHYGVMTDFVWEE